jgi:hypothetical protein
MYVMDSAAPTETKNVYAKNLNGIRYPNFSARILPALSQNLIAEQS